MANDQSIETLKGIGEKTAKLFEKVGVRTVDDLLHYYPRGYDTFEEPKPMGALEDGAVMAVDGCLKNGASGHHFGSASMVTASNSTSGKSCFGNNGKGNSVGMAILLCMNSVALRGTSDS